MTERERHYRRSPSGKSSIWECSGCLALVVDREGHDTWHVWLNRALLLDDETVDRLTRLVETSRAALDAVRR